MRRRAKAAYEFLLNSDDTPYADFDEEHRAFLQQYPDADDIRRKRWLQFIEREGIECALWPQLYWKMDKCLTCIRATDPRRLARQNKKETVKRIVNVSLTDDEKDFEATAGAQDGTFHSIRRAYAALAMAPLMDYGSSHELLHFAYDLSLWTDLGSKASLGVGVPLRMMISPEYCRSLHLGLTDMVRKRGFPDTYWTIPPLEWSMPHPDWIRQQMAAALRQRMRLAVPETLHIAHV